MEIKGLSIKTYFGCIKTLKIDVDGLEAFEIFEGFGQTKSTSQGFYGGGIYGIPNIVYISECLPKLASKIDSEPICDLNSINKFKGEYLTGKGRLMKVKGNYQMVEINYNTF